MTTQILLDAVDTNTDGAGFDTDGATKTLVVWGDDFGGGTVTVQGSPDKGTTWITLTITGSPVAFTANAIRFLERLGQGLQVRATLTGATSPSNVSAALCD